MVFSLTSHTPCQNLNCVCQLTCILFLDKFLRVKGQKLAKTLSNIYIAHTSKSWWLLQNKSHWINMMKLANIVEHANKTIRKPHVPKKALTYSKIFKLCSFGSPNTRMQLRIWLSLKQIFTNILNVTWT